MRGEAIQYSFQTEEEAWNGFFGLARDYDIGLFVGAGMSLDNGAPSWWNLVQRLGGWNDADIEGFRKLDLAVDSLFEIARGDEDDKDWRNRLRTEIYAGFYRDCQLNAQSIQTNTLEEFITSTVKKDLKKLRCALLHKNPNLAALLKLCAPRKGKPNHRIGPVLTTNVDCFFQIYDIIVNGRDGVFEVVEMVLGETDAEKLSLYHLHGYLSVFERDQKHIPFVFTESEYLERNDSPYSWANTTIHWAIREFNMLFIGFSMADNLVRRALLRSSKERASILDAGVDEKTWRRHYCILKMGPSEAVDRIRNANLAKLGVWPLWIKDYSEIAVRLEHLRKALAK